MRADLSTIQQTLAPEAAAALTKAMEEAARRRHGQTTPLHVAASLLAAPAGLLRRACGRAGAADRAHPLQCRALELCFSVALDRLPSAGGGGAGATGPPVSNALMAALKRAQAQQRRGCPEAQQQPLLAVKVELEQLVLSILDDPSVSRVMREASFSSAAVKDAIDRSTSPPTHSAAAATTATPLALPRGGAAIATSVAGRSNEEDAHKVIEIMLRPTKHNPVLVGDADPDSLLKDVLQRIAAGNAPEPLRSVKVITLWPELASAASKSEVPAIIRQLGPALESPVRDHGVVVDVGNLKWLIEGAIQPHPTVSEASRAAVVEMGRLLKRFDGCGARLWLIGTAASTTYLRCKVYHPALESEWNLQALPITQRVGAFHGLSPRLRESPMRGPPVPTPAPLQWPHGGAAALVTSTPSMCNLCSRGYEHELAKLVAAQKVEQPSLCLQDVSSDWLKLGTSDQPKMEQEIHSNRSSEELQKKWRDTCRRIHPARPAAPPASTLSMAQATATTPPRSSVTLVKTDLVLRRQDPAEVPVEATAAEKFSFKDGLSEQQKAKIASISDIDSFKRLLKGLTDKVAWQADAASAVAAAVVQCRFGGNRRQSSGPRGDMWLLFVGPDTIGKIKMAAALSELMFNASAVVISFAAGSLGVWGRASLDRVADTVRQNPFSVIVLQDVDQADALTRSRVRQAIETGRLLDSHGREVALGNVIFVLTADWPPPELAGDETYRSLVRSEERIVCSVNRCWQLELSIDHRNPPAKHRPDWLCADVRPAKVAKDSSGGSGGLSLDLNLAIGSAASEDTGAGEEGSRNSSDITVENETGNGSGLSAFKSPTSSSSPPTDLLEFVDDAVLFRPVDFTPVRRKVADCVAGKVRATVGHAWTAAVDDNVLDRMVAGVWLNDTKIEEWTDTVLAPYLHQLKASLKSNGGVKQVVRLSAVTEAEGVVKGRAGGAGNGLPSSVTVVGRWL